MLNSKNKTQAIHDIQINPANGSISIDCDNIATLTIKYYLIDAEILFSRSPFVQDQAD